MQVSSVPSSRGVGKGKEMVGRGWNGMGRAGTGRLDPWRGDRIGGNYVHCILFPFPGPICRHRSTWTSARNFVDESSSRPIASAGLYPEQEDKCPLTLEETSRLQNSPVGNNTSLAASAALARGNVNRIGLRMNENVSPCHLDGDFCIVKPFRIYSEPQNNPTRCAEVILLHGGG